MHKICTAAPYSKKFLVTKAPHQRMMLQGSRTPKLFVFKVSKISLLLYLNIKKKKKHPINIIPKRKGLRNRNWFSHCFFLYFFFSIFFGFTRPDTNLPQHEHKHGTTLLESCANLGLELSNMVCNDMFNKWARNRLDKEINGLGQHVIAHLTPLVMMLVALQTSSYSKKKKALINKERMNQSINTTVKYFLPIGS